MDRRGTTNLLETLEKEDEIIIYMSKFPGDIVEGLETYPKTVFF